MKQRVGHSTLLKMLLTSVKNEYYQRMRNSLQPIISPESIHPVPWDTQALGINCYEILDYSESIFKDCLNVPGHYSIKIDPRNCKKILHEYGFYYCDTLLEVYCEKKNFISIYAPDVTIALTENYEPHLKIAKNAFSHDRFHRDFNVAKELADQRYFNWLKEIARNHQLYELKYTDQIAGFIGCIESKIVLLALDKRFQGKGLAKFFWTLVCQDLFANGHDVVLSSISATNLSMVNLCASLGFKFRDPKDIYHRLISK
jgi:hypothetical protein